MAKTYKRIQLNNVIGAWVDFIFQAREPKDGKPGKFGLAMLIPKERSAEWDPLRVMLMESVRNKFAGKFSQEDGKPASDEYLAALIKAGKIKWPIHDGDVEQPGDKNFAGMVYCNASAKAAPGIVDAKVKRITSKEQCFSGCILNVDVTVFAFENESSGAALGLNNVQVVKWQGVKRLDSRKPPEEVFREVEGDSLTGSAPSAARGGSITGLI